MAKITEKILDKLYEIDAWRIVRKLNRNSLTVLNYHRIADVDSLDFDTFRPNVSATREMFANQLDYVNKYFNLVTLSELVEWVEKGRELPSNAALITFDDGYKDNYENAYPELAQRNMGAVIFITTNYMENDTPFYWDLIAYCIKNTKKNALCIDELGSFEWTNSTEIEWVTDQIIGEIKSYSDIQKMRIVNNIVNALDISFPINKAKGMFLEWEEINEMVRHGIEMGGHTKNHPILTKIPLSEAEKEVKGSKQILEEKIGKEVVGFAYPNGQEGDFNDEIINILKENGYRLGFSLISGPDSCHSIKREPYSIRRIFLSHHDSMARFVSKLYGVPRIRDQILGLLGK